MSMLPKREPIPVTLMGVPCWFLSPSTRDIERSSEFGPGMEAAHYLIHRCMCDEQGNRIIESPEAVDDLHPDFVLEALAAIMADAMPRLEESSPLVKRLSALRGNGGDQ